jgi:hypothetical protein
VIGTDVLDVSRTSIFVVVICSLFNDTVTNSVYISSNDWMTLNKEIAFFGGLRKTRSTFRIVFTLIEIIFHYLYVSSFI